MPQTLIFPNDQLPTHFRWQISAGVRYHFEHTFREVPHLRWWDGIVVDHPAWSVIVAEGDLLISHAGIIHRS